MDAKLATALRDYFQGEGAETAYLFGSRSTGKNRPDSDYDLAVLWPEPFDPIEGFSLSARMESELRSLCGGDVDLVFLNQASPPADVRSHPPRSGPLLQ